MPGNASLSPAAALTDLPSGLRQDLLDAFSEIVSNYRERRWEPAVLNGGKLCEAVYTIVVGHIDGSYLQRATKPKDMVSACRALEQRTTGTRAERIQIPRMLVALYEIRNNRGVGHAGGDVNPNQMDATAVLYMSKWLMVELVRVFHNLTTDEADDIVSSLVTREVALIWTLGDKRRILRAGLSLKQKMLLLMLTERGLVAERDLASWLEHGSVARLRRDILRPAHKANLIDLDERDCTVILLPPGVSEAERLIASL